MANLRLHKQGPRFTASYFLTKPTGSLASGSIVQSISLLSPLVTKTRTIQTIRPSRALHKCCQSQSPPLPVIALPEP